MRPRSIRVDICTRCQLSCPSCPTAQGETARTLGSGAMSAENFKVLMRANPWVQKVDLSNWGESLLSPELPEILKFAFHAGIELSIGTGANLNYLPDGLAEKLVKYRLSLINCAIDGASQEVYSRYRVKGSFDQVIANIKKINRYKLAYRSQYPRLRWQFIGFGLNEHELEKAKAMARELDMEFIVKLSWDEEFSPIQNKLEFEKSSGLSASSRSEYLNKVGQVYTTDHTCAQLWLQPKINWDGEVYGCSTNRTQSYGNVFKKGLTKILNGEQMAYARKMVQGQAPPRTDIPCTSCSKYQAMSRSGAWIRAPKSPGITKQFREGLLAFYRRLVGRVNPSYKGLMRWFSP